MPRRSGRIATHSSPSTTASGTKRPLEPSAAGPSKKLSVKTSPNVSPAGQKSRESNPKKSKYFEDRASDSSSDELSTGLSEEEASGNSSDYNAAENRAAGSHSRTHTRNPGKRRAPSQEPPGTSKGKKRTGDTRATAPSRGKGGKELWREGVRTGLGPGKEVFISLPKARDPGNVSYEDHTIHPNTMLFLRDLKDHNEREWFKSGFSH